jgi:hypothetical protein
MPLASSRSADKEAIPWTAVPKSWQAARLARQMAPLSSRSNAGHPAFSRTKSVCRLISQNQYPVFLFLSNKIERQQN